MIVQQIGVLAASLSLLTACGDAPTYGMGGPQEIAYLRLDGSGPPIHPGGALSVDAALADTYFVLSPSADLPFFISTSRGDLERSSLASLMCPVRLEGGYQHHCRMIVITMESGQDVRSIEPRLRAWGGRFRLVAPRLQFASAIVVRHAGLPQRLREIEDWPGVRSAYFEGRPGFIIGQPQRPLRSLLHATLPIEPGTVRVGDGAVQAEPGDTIHLSYRQPSGAMLSSSAIVQPPPTDQCWFFPPPC